MAIKANLVIDQGTDYSTVIYVTDENGDIVVLTGFIVDIAPLSGTVTLTMNAATTNAISSGRYVYDCELRTSANVVSRLLEGIVTVTPQVTR
jgi:predicted GTPase